ncbi:MAG: hypothetical protein M3Q07_26925, partial [Pseudobdellovibrionaceae bacterium]|nr:hypothetical protein [Pseudobdellovibrionaceae bacterium]
MKEDSSEEDQLKNELLEMFLKRAYAEDKALERAFSLSGQDALHVNIWDDFDPETDGGTHVYLEMTAPLAVHKHVM